MFFPQIAAILRREDSTGILCTIRNLNNILPDKSHIVFHFLISISPLGIYSRRTRIGRVYRYVTTTRQAASEVRDNEAPDSTLVGVCYPGHTDSFILRTDPQRQVHLCRRPRAMPVMMIYSRQEFDTFLFDAGFHDGVRLSCRLVHPHTYLTMMRYVMI